MHHRQELGTGERAEPAGPPETELQTSLGFQKGNCGLESQLSRELNTKRSSNLASVKV